MNKLEARNRKKIEPIGAWAKDFRATLKAMSKRADQTAATLRGDKTSEADTHKKPIRKVLDEASQAIDQIEFARTPNYHEEYSDQRRAAFHAYLESLRKSIHDVEFVRTPNYHEAHGMGFIRDAE